MIGFYPFPKPNSWIVAIMLAETGLDYREIHKRQERRDLWAINPEAKFPAIVDHSAVGSRMTVNESGAILLFLAEKSGQFGPGLSAGDKAFYEWLFWQPTQVQRQDTSAQDTHGCAGQAYETVHETFESLLTQIETRLDGQDYLFREYTIADMANFPWVLVARLLGLDLNRFPNVTAWRDRILSRSAVRTAINLNTDSQHSTTAAAIQYCQYCH
ncbi:glutathione S-transferase family protein [Epibacterium ulvae]|uniref:glutathione S-transferase family protein n=1 Tax=Epibacterium ulvae TaxID=1156985 RepID=UPI001BFCB89A|nr:glutathione S-transferase family protein [Epibacterium ulvae]MBT8155116.1 glutathione S-transferase family protein [Epibacterium ulvae]